ncbi:MAG: hypothetical protein IPJ60_18720 [Sphingobacteriaceae bacterium]|nr:hypothetical protein [Sphingobacteriaceae bacterium]
MAKLKMRFHGLSIQQKSGFWIWIDFINADTGIVCCYPVDGENHIDN